MTLPRRNWMEMTWQDIAGAAGATARWIAVLPLAAVEQHGPHLPLGVDTYIAEAYLARVQKLLPADLPVTFLPVQRIGVSAEHLSFPGTLTLSAATAMAAWTELGESLARAGVRKLVLVTSHGGNVAAMESVARDLRTRLGMLAVTVGWHRFGYPDGAFSADEKKHGIHGGDIETSLMLAAQPATVRMAASPKRNAGDDRDGGRIQMARCLPARWLRLDDAGPQPHRRGRQRDTRQRHQGRSRARPWRQGIRGIASGDQSLRSRAAEGRTARGAEGFVAAFPVVPSPLAGEGVSALRQQEWVRGLGRNPSPERVF